MQDKEYQVSMSLIPSGELKVVITYPEKMSLSRINESNSLRGVESEKLRLGNICYVLVSMSLIPSGELKEELTNIIFELLFIVSMSLIPSGELKVKRWYAGRDKSARYQ